MSLFLVILIGVTGGLAGSMQSGFLGVMQNRVGTLASTFITYGGGGLAIGLIMLALGGSKWSDLKEVPWWAFTAGLMGLVVVASLGIVIARLGLGGGITLFMGSTLILGALIDHFGLFAQGHTIDPRRLAGIAMVVFGTWLVVGGSGNPA
jgi:transporter family-2 protein